MDPVALTKQPESAESEIDRIDPDPTLVELPVNGAKLRLVRLSTRQLFRLLRVLTHGAGGSLVQEVMNFQPGMDEEAVREFGLRMMTLILLAVPDAENEFMEFLGSMFLPDGFVDKPNRDLSDEQRAVNDALMKEFTAATWNPQPEDSFTMIQAIITQESKDIVGLGNRVALLVRTLRPAKAAKS